MTLFVDRVIVPWLWFLAEWSLRWGVVLAVIAAWLALRPPRRAATRHLLCAVALIAGLLLSVSPRWKTGLVVRHRQPQSPVAQRPRALPADQDAHRDATQRFPATRPSGPIGEAEPRTRVSPPIVGGTATVAPDPAFGVWRGFALVVFMVWASGTLVLFARLLTGQVELRRLRRGSHAVGEGSLLLLNECRVTLGLSRRVRLEAHPAVASPIALGGLSPVVLVPPDWDGWPEIDRRACLMHELAHLNHGDDWAKLVQELVRAPFFFHPLVRWLLARLDRERELLCDEVVVGLGADPVAYARLILGLAQRPGRLLPAAVKCRPGWLPFLDRRTVAVRIERLLEDDMPRSFTPIPLRRRLATGVLTLTAALGVGGLTVRAVEPRVKEDDRPPPAAAKADVAAPQVRRVSGAVRDAEGNALAGVVVVFGVEKPERHPEVLTTGADGRFTFLLPAGEVQYALAAHKEALSARALQNFLVAGKAPEEITLVLRPSALFRATLVDPEGRAVPQALIRIKRTATHGKLHITATGRETGETIGTRSMYVPWKVVSGTKLEGAFTATSDEQGRFSFDSLPPDCWVKLSATVPGRGAMLVASRGRTAGPEILIEQGYVASPADLPATFILTPAAKVRGRVVTRLPGVSVAGHDVGLQGTFEADRPFRAIDWAEARTAADGHFEIDGLNAGIANIFLTDGAPDGPWTYRAVKNARLILGEATEVEIELIAGVEVEGRVLAGSATSHVAGASVGLYGPIRPRSGAAIIIAKTDSYGKYRFRLPPGETYFYICGPIPGYTSLPGDGSSRTVTIPEGSAQFLVPPIEVQPAVRVRGRIVDAKGLAVIGARIVGVCDQNRCMPLDQTSAVTDTLGWFHLSDPVGGQFPVNQASSFQVVLRDGRQFEVAAVPAATGEVHLKIQAISGTEVKGPATVAPRELAGVVVDADGKPIEGVEVTAFHWIPKPPTTSTDADGLFRLAKLPDGGRINIRLRKEGYETQYHDRSTGEPGWVAVLGNETYFEGRVLAPDGSFVPHAPIRADAGPKRFGGSLHTETLSETKSRPDGSYRLHVVPDQYDISVRVPGAGVARLSKEVIATDQHRTLDIHLAPGVVFVARVVDRETGKPVEGARLWHWQRPGIEGTSDANGQIQIRDVPPGKYPRFEFEATGYTRWWSDACLSEWSRYQKVARHGFQRNFDGLDFDIQPGMAAVTIQVERGTTVRGQVLDPDGVPVAGATVAPALTGSGNSLTGDTRFSVETGKDGRFEVLLPASGDIAYNLVAHDGKFRQWRTWANGVVPPFKTTPGQEIEGLEIRLTRPGTVTGRIVDDEGNPVADREVRAEPTARDENRYYDPTTKTGPDGIFTLKFVRPGEHYIQAAPFWLEARQAPEGTSRTVVVTAGETVAGVDLKGASER